MEKIRHDKFKANAIFLQPTFHCSKGCDGCYVHEKEHKFDAKQASFSVWADIINDAVGMQDNIATGQVTLALDTMPVNDHADLMFDIAQEYFGALSFKKAECHITTNHIADLLKYIESGENIEDLDLLSISNILSVEQIAQARLRVPGTKINWNVMSGEFVKQVNRQGLDAVKQIVKKVDSVYLLLSKAPMGLGGHDFSSFFQALEVLKSFKNEPVKTDGQACAIPDLSSKFVMDGCMVDTAKFKKTGYGCSANVSRYQIWPDGRVTGCAYNSHNQYGKFAESFDDVLDNLRDAKTRYEFDSCSIPKGLDEHSKHKKLQVVHG